MSDARSTRYRRLALAEPDVENARLLRLLADEADRGVLCTVEWAHRGSKIEIPIKSSAAEDSTLHIYESDLGWFAIRDLGAVLDHEGSLGERGLTVAAATKAFHASSCF